MIQIGLLGGCRLWVAGSIWIVVVGFVLLRARALVVVVMPLFKVSAPGMLLLLLRIGVVISNHWCVYFNRSVIYY